ncbi:MULTISPECIES: hypothetical protein [Dictyoglomus]|jgi:predicted anti-sigma-YlaC factor YlaD|uniref:Zf-HC2 domain-containing protein n=1 Tax=Dictyoglomus turgidum (strain DSM 6724 / Z-1310) TaxID=515635 RepID=B8DYM5_DICTD|nr:MULTISPECIES: hypothetical protein [Dictyoglomus]ACK41407.1 conserved hypothetical protein [Dictyoglomus turgidum DSM 6724]PNV78779.1 MAG: hypothetical protein C0196_08130 [Dictyoglomus turgidum]HBU31588.1 hypothetical protein [Dictyoglomus sp.]
MNCKEFREKMFLHEEIGEDFFLHLEECNECRREFEDFLRIEEKLKERVFEEESGKEWSRVYKSVYNRLMYEKIKRRVFIFLLVSLEIILLSLIFFFVYRVGRFFLQDFLLLSFMLNSLFQILFQVNFYLFLFTLLLFIYQNGLHRKYK